MNYENLDFPDAIENIAARMGIEVPREESSVSQKNGKRISQFMMCWSKVRALIIQAQLRRASRQRTRAVEYSEKPRLVR